jgi:Transposase DNA-binding
MPSLSDVRNWAITEFADAELGDWRRTQRLVDLAALLAHPPSATRPEACGHGARLTSADRFFANDDIAPYDILQSPTEATCSRLAQVPVVLAVQDTTEIDWTSQHATTGLGPLGPHACPGLLVHSTLAITPERVPLGLWAQPGWARAPHDTGKKARRTPRPMAQKASQKWLGSLAAVCHAQASGPATRMVRVGDRAADVYALLAAERPDGVDLVIRASWNRWVQTPPRYVWDTVEAQPGAARLTVPVPRRGAQPAREATLSRRYPLVPWCPPRHRAQEGWPAVVIGAVQV